MARSNRELIKYYKDKHEAEPVLFSEKGANDRDIKIDGIVTPLKLDLRQYCSPSDDQGETSHCAAYTAAQIIEAKYWKETGKLIQLDASQIYAKAKEIDGVIDADGTYPEITLKCALDLSKKLITDKYEVKKCYNYGTNQTIATLKRLIHKNGFLAGGFRITEDWYRLKKGDSFLDSAKKRTLGGHCVTVVGYLKDSLIIQNSWGKEWGAMGFGRISWDLVLKQLMYVAYLERKAE